MAETNKLIEILKKFQISNLSNEWFAITLINFNDVETKLCFRVPKVEEYGRFCYALYRLAKIKKLTRMLYKPYMLPMRKAAHFMKHCTDKDMTIETLMSESVEINNKKPTDFLYILSGTNNQERCWAALYDSEVSREDDKDVRFEETEYLVRCDVGDWDKDTSVFKHMLSVGTMSEDFDKCKEELDSYKISKELDCDNAPSIIEYVRERGNRNFIDLRSDLTVETPLIEKCLRALAPKSEDDPDYDKLIECGVLLINNVAAIDLQDHNVNCQCKITSRMIDGSPRINLRTYSPEGIGRLTASWSFTRNGKRGAAHTVKWIKLWMEHPLRARISNTVFSPWPISMPDEDLTKKNGEYITNRTVNTFSGYRWTFEELKEASEDLSANDALEEWRKLILEGFVNRVEEHYNYFMNWLAWTIQNPRNKTGVAIVIKSLKGVGKGFFSQVLQKFYGDGMLFVPGKGIDDNFNSHLANRLLIWLDEMNGRTANKSNMDLIKSWLTDPGQIVQQKYKDAYATANCTNFLAATNNDICFEITTDNRRWVIFESDQKSTQEKVKSWHSFITALWEPWLQDSKNNYTRIRRVFYELATRDITGFQPWNDIPITPYMIQVMERSIPPVHAWWRAVLNRRHLRDNEDIGRPIDGETHRWCAILDLFHESQINGKSLEARRAVRIKENEFTASLSRIAFITNRSSSSGTFKFGSWEDQIIRWNNQYPDFKIPLNYNESANPFQRARARAIIEKEIKEDVLQLTHEERAYVIEVLRDKLKETGTNVNISGSVFLSTNSTESESLVEFVSNSNKRQRLS